MNYQTFPPHSHLESVVKCCWTLEVAPEKDTQRKRIVPDGCLEMIFILGDDIKRYTSGDEFIIQPRDMVLGQIPCQVMRLPGERTTMSSSINPKNIVRHIRKLLIFIAFLFSCTITAGQEKHPEEFGFRHLQTIYKGDTVDILVKSKSGEELKPKPLFMFFQGSLPQPLIKYDEKGMFGVFTFNPDSLVVDFHLAIISKPYIPVVAEIKKLGEGYTYQDSSGAFPYAYTQRNYLSYYVKRNIHVIRFLQKQKWISGKRLVVAGHSEGSTIAAKIASVFPKVNHLIYSGGNPMGRISTLIEQARARETDSTLDAEREFDYWQQVISDPGNTMSKGDTYKATYEFSVPPIQYLLKLKIPVLVCYGTKDAGSPFNDYLRVEAIRGKKSNFTFKAYIGTEHNYFPIKSNGEIDHDTFNWEKVADDWRRWLMAR